MPKWLGNRFGNAVPVNPGNPAPSAIYNMFDQYYMKQEGGYLKTVFAGSGGTKVIYNGIVYHTFTSSGAFTVTEPAGLSNITSVNLLVQGAGAGGGMIGGGGGAGGQVQATGVSLPVSGGPYPVVIGSGGACATGPGARGSDGGDTTFNSPTTNFVTAKGGGGGGTHQGGATSVSGNPGGCGGGGSDNSGSPTMSYGTSNQPTSTPLPGTFNYYGNRGGTGSPTYLNAPRGGGGGGGTGAAGQDFPNRDGGDGRPYTIPTKDNPTTQTNYWFGGGGGGGPYENNKTGAGGRGGGGGGYNDNPGGAALSTAGADGYGGDVNRNPTIPGQPDATGGIAATNSGGGGGGAKWTSFPPGLITGGPGIVVISYPNTLN